MVALKFSAANAKLQQLNNIQELEPYLRGGRKVYSFDSGLSGWTCPGAKDCLSKVIVNLETGKKTVKDGPDTQFRCFSASQEALLPVVYAARKNNQDILQAQPTLWDMARVIVDALPPNLGVLRLNVAGDIFNQQYFDALIVVARSCPGILFYAYTKSLPFWVARLDNIPDNLILTASRGGRRDDLIDTHNLRNATVLFKTADIVQAEREGWPIDHDDSHAARPSMRDKSFYLLVHNVQPAGSEAAKGKQYLKGRGSYNKKKDN